MKNKLIFNGLLGFLLCATTWSKAQSAPTNPISWGSEGAQGLRLGAWQDKKYPYLLRLQVRNTGSQTVRYNLCFLTMEGIGVWARPVGQTKWTELHWHPKAMFAREGVGPTAYPLRWLAPQASIPVFSNRFDGTLMAPKYQQGFYESCSLGSYAWPAQWKGQVAVKVTQILGSDRARPSVQGVLWSGTLIFDLAQMRRDITVSRARGAF